MEHELTTPQLMLLAGTRGALGLGIGLLLASRLRPETRRGAGLALVAVGALTTIPLMMTVFGPNQRRPLAVGAA
jgi:hypothetical protein